MIIRIVFLALIVVFAVGSCQLVWERDAQRRRTRR